MAVAVPLVQHALPVGGAARVGAGAEAALGKKVIRHTSISRFFKKDFFLNSRSSQQSSDAPNPRAFLDSLISKGVRLPPRPDPKSLQKKATQLNFPHLATNVVGLHLERQFLFPHRRPSPHSSSSSQSPCFYKGNKNAGSKKRFPQIFLISKTAFEELSHLPQVAGLLLRAAVVGAVAVDAVPLGCIIHFFKKGNLNHLAIFRAKPTVVYPIERDVGPPPEHIPGEEVPLRGRHGGGGGGGREEDDGERGGGNHGQGGKRRSAHFFEKCLALCQERGKRNPSLFIRPSAACDTSRSIYTANTIYTQELLAFPPLRQLRIRINKNHFLPPPTPLCREVRFPESFHDFSPLSDLWSYPLTLLRN